MIDFNEPLGTKVCQIHGGRTQTTLPPARMGYQPCRFFWPVFRKEPLKVFDFNGRLLAAIKPGATRRFAVVRPWWWRGPLRWLKPDAAVWEERP